jgi:hypothetical protein
VLPIPIEEIVNKPMQSRSERRFWAGEALRAGDLVVAHDEMEVVHAHPDGVGAGGKGTSEAEAEVQPEDRGALREQALAEVFLQDPPQEQPRAPRAPRKPKIVIPVPKPGAAAQAFIELADLLDGNTGSALTTEHSTGAAGAIPVPAAEADNEAGEESEE